MTLTRPRLIHATLLALVALVGISGWHVSSFAQAAAQQTAPSPRSAPTFTPAQAALGQTAYRASCASCHGESGKRIRLQDLPDLTKNPGDGIGFAAWPAYRVSSGELWGMQRRLNDCYRQQRFPYPGYASDVTIALGVYMGVNAKGAESIAPALKR